MARRGQFERTVFYSSRALELYRELDYVRSIPMELLSRAEARAALGDLDDARTDVNEAINLAERMGFGPVSLLQCHHVAAFVELLADDPTTALDHSLKARNVVDDAGERNLLLGTRLHEVIARSLLGDLPRIEEAWADVQTLAASTDSGPERLGDVQRQQLCARL